MSKSKSGFVLGSATGCTTAVGGSAGSTLISVSITSVLTSVKIYKYLKH